MCFLKSHSQHLENSSSGTQTLCVSIWMYPKSTPHDSPPLLPFLSLSTCFMDQDSPWATVAQWMLLALERWAWKGAGRKREAASGGVRPRRSTCCTVSSLCGTHCVPKPSRQECPSSTSSKCEGLFTPRGNSGGPRKRSSSNSFSAGWGWWGRRKAVVGWGKQSQVSTRISWVYH